LEGNKIVTFLPSLKSKGQISMSMIVHGLARLRTTDINTSTLLWWDYSEGGSKYGSGCLNFDQSKIVAKMSCELPHKKIHMIFWQLFCVSQNSNNVPDILIPPQNSPTTAVQAATTKTIIT
jgi:hypothetical protein